MTIRFQGRRVTYKGTPAEINTILLWLAVRWPDPSTETAK